MEHGRVSSNVDCGYSGALKTRKQRLSEHAWLTRTAAVDLRWQSDSQPTGGGVEH